MSSLRAGNIFHCIFRCFMNLKSFVHSLNYLNYFLCIYFAIINGSSFHYAVIPKWLFTCVKAINVGQLIFYTVTLLNSCKTWMFHCWFYRIFKLFFFSSYMFSFLWSYWLYFQHLLNNTKEGEMTHVPNHCGKTNFRI